MNKEQFLFRLDRSLLAMPIDARSDLLADYEDHFRSGLEDGKSEDEIAFDLGIPEDLAREALEFQSMPHSSISGKATIDTSSNAHGYAAAPKWNASFSPTRLAILLFWNLIAIPLWAAAWSCAAAMGVAVLAMLASPLLFAADGMLNNAWNIAEFFAMLMLLGIGLLIVGPFANLVKWLVVTVMRYVSWNAGFVMRRN